jgi:23S rRNA (adenine-N6)-dimethyltransferase
VSPRFALELVGHTNIRKRDVVLDIGAGSGVFTQALAKRAREVIAVEIERNAVEKLRRNMARFDNVEVVRADFMNYRLPKAPYKVVSNIPFHLSSEIVQKLVFDTNKPESIYLIVQKQFAEKMKSDTRRFTCALGITSGVLYEVRVRRPLKKTDFYPRPAIDAVFLELKRREEPLITVSEIDSFRELVTECFDKPKVFSSIQKMIPEFPSLKPSELTLDEWMQAWEKMK